MEGCRSAREGGVCLVARPPARSPSSSTYPGYRLDVAAATYTRTLNATLVNHKALPSRAISGSRLRALAQCCNVDHAPFLQCQHAESSDPPTPCPLPSRLVHSSYVTVLVKHDRPRATTTPTPSRSPNVMHDDFRPRFFSYNISTRSSTLQLPAHASRSSPGVSSRTSGFPLTTPSPHLNPLFPAVSLLHPISLRHNTPRAGRYVLAHPSRPFKELAHLDPFGDVSASRNVVRPCPLSVSSEPPNAGTGKTHELRRSPASARTTCRVVPHVVIVIVKPILVTCHRLGAGGPCLHPSHPSGYTPSYRMALVCNPEVNYRGRSHSTATIWSRRDPVNNATGPRRHR